jgi:hypothetical protein
MFLVFLMTTECRGTYVSIVCNVSLRTTFRPDEIHAAHRLRTAQCCPIPIVWPLKRIHVDEISTRNVTALSIQANIQN